MPMFPFLFNGPCLSAWIPLVDVEEEHGPLRYLSESQNNEENVFQFIPHDHPQLVKAGQSALDMIEANEYFDPAKDRIRMGKCHWVRCLCAQLITQLALICVRSFSCEGGVDSG